MEGARIAELPVRHHARQFGKSKYNLTRTFRVIMDLTTIRLLMRHLRNPLSFFVKFSVICFLGSLLAFSIALNKVMVQNKSLSDVNILVTLVILLAATSVQFMFFGLIGRLIVESGSRRTFYQRAPDLVRTRR
jgi:hypothetical protein